MKQLLFFTGCFCIQLVTQAQEHTLDKDAVAAKSLDSIVITAYRQATLQTLPATQGTYLYSGKKTERINLQQTDANIADKTGWFENGRGVAGYKSQVTG